MEFYQYKPFENAYFKVQKPEFNRKFLQDGIILNKTDSSCWSIPQPCARRSGIMGTKKNSYIFWSRK
jgi:hypothetical protein